MRTAMALVVVLGLSAQAFGAPELYDAAKKGDEAAVAALIANKASVDEPNAQGWTPLIIAAYSGHLGVVRALLDAGANPNGADPSGFTAVIQAARFGHLDIVKLLHARKAKLDVRPTGSALRDKPLLHIVIEEKQDAVATWLLAQQGVDVNAVDGTGTTALMLAARRDVALVKALLGRKADVKRADAQGIDALATAAMRGDAAIATTLLAAGAVVDSKSKLGQTPLFHAAHGGHVELVKVFLGRGASARVKETKFGDTALLRAAQAGSTGVVKLLLDAGAPVDDANNDGATPLMVAAGNGHTAVIELLLARGANKDARDKKQQTAAMRANKSGHADAAKLLEARGAKVSPDEKRDGDRMARDRWYVNSTLSNCTMLDLSSVGLELCALSLPTAKPDVRSFKLTVRDMSRLEPGNKQTADHVLVGEVALQAAATEYVDIKSAGAYALGEHAHVVVVPIVTGTPSAYTDGRVLLYVYDDAKLRFTTTTPVWTSKACGAGCTAQSVITIKKAGAMTLEVGQTSAKGTTTTKLAWDAARRTLAPKPN